MDQDTHNRVIKVVLPEDLAEAALAAANARDLSRSSWIRGLIWSALYRAGQEIA